MAPRTQKKSAAEEKLTAGGSGVSASSGIPSRGKGDQVSKPTGAENAVKAEVTGGSGVSASSGVAAKDMMSDNEFEPIVSAAKRPRLQDAQELTKPNLPEEDNADRACRTVMKAVIPWVLQEFPKAMMRLLKEADVTEMCDREPLAIEAKDNDGSDGLASYKERWNPSACWCACQESGMYEAAGNATWVDPEVASTTTTLPSEDPPWSWVSSRYKAVLPVSKGKRERIVFPIPLKCFRRGGIAGLEKQAFPQGGLVLLSGHAFLYCWHLYVCGDGGA